jgi:hypothetical protein
MGKLETGRAKTSPTHNQEQIFCQIPEILTNLESTTCFFLKRKTRLELLTNPEKPLQ